MITCMQPFVDLGVSNEHIDQRQVVVVWHAVWTHLMTQQIDLSASSQLIS
jgi:hypothetical protein